jgi:hypothetical protein
VYLTCSGEGDETVPEVSIPKRHPKLYQLVAMDSNDSSFWWDSVDTNNEDTDFPATFDSNVSMTVKFEEEEEEEYEDEVEKEIQGKIFCRMSVRSPAGNRNRNRNRSVFNKPKTDRRSVF